MDGQAVSSDTGYEQADRRVLRGCDPRREGHQRLDRGAVRLPDAEGKTFIRHQGAGREVWKPADFIEIRIPMNLKEIRRRQVRESDKQKWPREWAAYQQTKTNPGFGTPLESLPFLTKAQVMEFKALGLKTAENVRDISDSDGQKYMGFQQLRRRVTDFLAAAEGNAPLATLRNEVTAKEAENNALKVQIQELIARSEKAKK
jgi:hypothetical protein